MLTTQITPWARHGVVLSEKSIHLNALIREIQSQVENFAELWRAQQ
jgi:hypothetical protein